MEKMVLKYDESTRPPPDACVIFFIGSQAKVTFWREKKVQDGRVDQVFTIEDSPKARREAIQKIEEALTTKGLNPTFLKKGPKFYAFRLSPKT
jgi:hypothetical protein